MAFLRRNSFSVLLQVCVKSQDRGAVKILFAKMKASGYVDVISFNTLLKATHGARSAKVLPAPPATHST